MLSLDFQPSKMSPLLVTFIMFYPVDIVKTFVHRNEVDFWSWLSFGPFRPSILKTRIITYDSSNYL